MLPRCDMFAGAEFRDEGGRSRRRGRIYDTRRFPVAPTVLAKRSLFANLKAFRPILSSFYDRATKKALVFKYLMHLKNCKIFKNHHV